MKKILIIILILGIGIITSCTDKKEGLENEVTIITPNGTPYIALGGLLENENIEISAVNGADNLKSALVSGSYDIVLAPVNLGSMLYANGYSKYQMAAVVTMNNAYIVTEATNKLDSIKDLEGENVIAFGQTGIPGSILKKVYANNDLDASAIDFSLASSSAVYSVFAGGSTDAKYALLSQPEIAKLEINDKKELKTLDLCEILNTDVPQACVYVNPESQYLEAVDKVLKLIEENISELNKDSSNYVKKIISLDRNFAATGEEVLIESLPSMDIVYKKASDFRIQIENILTILGVVLPNDSFYY